MSTAPPVVERAAARTDRPSPALPTTTGADDLLPGTRVLLVAFALLTGLATNQLLVLGAHTERYWAWTITGRPAAAFLGAAYAAGFVLSVLALRQRSWSRVHVAVKTVGVFTTLTLVATIVHAHRLHLWAADPLARSAAWFWLGVYVAVPAVCVGVVLLQEGRRTRGQTAGLPLPRWLRWLLGGQGAAIFAAGAALFIGALTVHHGTTTAGFWPWPLSPLGAEVVGAWLIAFGVGAALVIRERDLCRLLVSAVAYTVFGALQLAVLVSFRAELTGSAESRWTWAALLVAAVATGGFGWWSARSRARCAVAAAQATRRALV